MDDIGAIGLISLFACFKESELSGLTKLDYICVTYLRLLLRFQVSNPLDESGPLFLLASFR